jgi:hypothetical protein
METREDGYNYFIDYGREDDKTRMTLEYKYKSLGDGNVEAYERDISNQFIDTEFVRLQTMIKPDGSQNVILKTFSITLNNHLNISLHRRPQRSSGRTGTSKDSRPLNISLRDELRDVLLFNSITMSPFINEAITEKLQREGLL